MRYDMLDGHGDLGLGAEESGTARYTRPCERIESRDEDRLDIRIRAGMLTKAADLLHEVLLETAFSDRYRERLRDLALATKGLADEINNEMTMPPVHPAKNVTEGNSTPHVKEK